ncbi:uncharacterized protein LOC131548939 [Onychostoma macrolepis]|uniref:Uncharacterized protein n=1 Tax=Onychostoma macrolepis TaxID=369639 RepID=A0A7J6CK93_9TELE|nr:uncharacterized protein LOC131548939 [Onychostoma macrolepis]KAF4107748.1 hypothetical protein G5714_012112 [Onychostoma macrolepis]
MSKELQFSHHGHGENDEDSDGPDTRHFNHGHEETNEYCEVSSNIHENSEYDKKWHRNSNQRLPKKPSRVKFSSDINPKLLKKDTWKWKRRDSKKASVDLASATASGSGIIGMIDTIDRPADTNAEGTYTRAGSYVDGFENKPGRRIPKAGVYAEAGVGRYSAERSVFRVEAKGPNASVAAEATAARLGVGAMAQVEIASASVSAGPVDVKLGLGVDTGGYIGLGGVEAKILGFGFSVGRKTGISLLGSEVSFSL